MSSKSNLGKRNDFKLAPPLGVGQLDFALTISHFKKESYAELEDMNVQSTSKVSSTVETSKSSLKETMDPTTDDNYESSNRKKKYRRSMLGQRTKLYNLDSAINISKNLLCDDNKIDQANKSESFNPIEKLKSNYRSTETPSSHKLKPKCYFSTPNSENQIDRQRLRHDDESTSPLNPFGFDDCSSKFFESEINNIGSWSVFKTRHTGIKSPSASSTDSRLNISSQTVKVPAKDSTRKNFKTKLFDRDEHSEVFNKGNEEMPESTLNGSSGFDMKSIKDRRWLSASKSISKPKFESETDNETSPDIDSDTLTSSNESYKSNDKVGSTDQSSWLCNEEQSSNDSFCLAESTIIAAEKRSASKAPKLSIICEEDAKIGDNLSVLPNFIETTSPEPQEQQFSPFTGNLKQDLEQLNQICQTVQMHSDVIDKTLQNLFNEKKAYNSSFKLLQKRINEFHRKHNSDKDAGTFIKPNSIKSKPREISKSYSELRKSFSYLKTPDQKRRVKKESLCYTPKSLSSCISQQLENLQE